jgi:hypothetical protein
MSSVVVDDARRWAGFRAFASYFLLVEIRPWVNWARSANRSGLPPTVAAFYAREALNRCLALESLVAGGSIPDVEEPFFNPFHRVDRDVVASAVGLAGEIADCDDETEVGAVLSSVENVVRAIESALGLDEPLPSLDGPEGMYPALRVARESLQLSDDAGLPLAMPGDWMPDRKAG